MDPKEIIAVYKAGPEAVVCLVERLLQTMAEQAEQIETQQRRLSSLEKENEVLKATVARLNRDSTNSSKPPSSDGLKKERGSPKRGSSGRKPGGQKGHPGKTRTRVPQSEVSDTVDHKPTSCEGCGESFSENSETEIAERRQVFEIPEINPIVIEHIFYKITCKCGHQTRLAVPDWVFSGIGERLQALMAYLTSEGRLSRRTLEKILQEIWHVPIALGTIQNRLEDTSKALQPVCDELEDVLAEQSVLNIDETGYPHNKKLHWLWAFVTSTFVFFAIRASRASKVLKEVLGELFDGIIICDRFSAYVKYHKDRACGLIQYCWAHIIRNAKALGYALAHNSKKPFSRLMRGRMGAVFRLWYAFKAGAMSRETLIQKAQVHIDGMRAFLEDNLNCESKEVRTFCRELLKKWDSLFTFIYHEGVEPTNNLAERMIRPGVQTRKISYCTRSENGQLLLARLLTVSLTCRMQGRAPFEFYLAAIRAKRHGLAAPSLLVTTQDAQQKLSA